jgi:very-short-patch-repair endonuclease
MNEIPEALRGRPFAHDEARRHGVSARMLMGSRFVRIHPRVWRCADHEMSDADHVTAARLALPEDARLTGITRIQLEGLDFGPRRPVRLVVARDHHVDLDGLFLHRTERMPPTDDRGVTPAAAFIAYCALARVIDAVRVGDWLLHHGRMTLPELRDLALGQQWRDGADEAIWLLDHLDGRSRSLPESDIRSMLRFAGLPAPEVNENLAIAEGTVVQGDLLYRALRLLVEYEGAHHQEDRAQYASDIDRYADIRRAGLDYVQVTREKAREPQRMVREVHARMVELGYDGPAPDFGERWRSLFCSVAVAVGPRHTRFRAS